MASGRWLWWLLPVAAGAWLASCTYDFDEAFSETPTLTGSGTISTGGGGSGGATAGAGGVAGDGGQGTGAQSGGENCANNADDDGDQAVDCADPDCVPDWECTERAPAGWQGPVMYVVDTPGSLPPCAAPLGIELRGGAGLTVPDAVCNACSCGTPTINCQIGDLRIYNFPGCNSLRDVYTANNPNTCQSESGPTPDSFRAYAANPLPGSQCAASGGGVDSLPPATWDEEALLCTGTIHAGGCADDGLCMPKDELSPFARCVYRTGDTHSCPSGSPYSEHRQFGRTMAEGRSCTDCACDSPANIQCDGTYHVWDSPSCGSLPADQELSTVTENCVDDASIGANFGHMFEPAYTADDCSVSATAGVSAGTVTETDPYTVCCMP